jgi:hypothetical protein
MMQFRTRWRNEADSWTPDGDKITAVEKLEAIRKELARGPIIVEHWHYRGGSAPSRQVFEDYDVFRGYLQAEAFAGDAIDIWSWSSLCMPACRLVEGKCPAEDGMVPQRGAY